MASIGRAKASILWVVIPVLAACSRPADQAASPAPGPDAERGAAQVALRVAPLVAGRAGGTAFQGIHGLTFDRQDRLYAGSVVGQAIFRVDPGSGTIERVLGPPQGMADDLEWSPDGSQLAWTAILAGKVYARTGDGPVVELATGLPGANSIAWNAQGRLFVTQVFFGDGVWELDPAGAKPPRQVASDLGGLNGFDFGPDGKIYGPIWFKAIVARVDPETGAVATVADGFKIPAAANFDSKGNLFVVDTGAGEVIRVDPESGAKTVVARVPTSIDNLAIDSHDRIFISNMARNGIYQIAAASGQARTVTELPLAVPAGLALADGVLHVADAFAYRTVDAASGAVTTVGTMFGVPQEQLDYPLWAFADEDHVVLTSWVSGTVQTIDRQSGATLRMEHRWNQPVAAVELPDGRPVVAELGSGPSGGPGSGRLIVVEDDWKTRDVVFEGLQTPAGLLPAGGTAVWVTELGPGTLARIDTATGERTVVASGLASPEGLAQLPDGRIVVALVGARSLVAIDPASGAQEVVASDLPIGLPAPQGAPPSFVPTGVAAAADGTVYFTSDLESALYRVLPAGSGF